MLRRIHHNSKQQPRIATQGEHLLPHRANNHRADHATQSEQSSSLLPECRGLMRSDIRQLASVDRLVVTVWHPPMQLSCDQSELWLIVHITGERVTNFLLALKYGFCLFSWTKPYRKHYLKLRFLFYTGTFHVIISAIVSRLDFSPFGRSNLATDNVYTYAIWIMQ